MSTVVIGVPFIPVHPLARDDGFSLSDPRCLMAEESVSIGFGMGDVMNVIFCGWRHPDRMKRSWQIYSRCFRGRKYNIENNKDKNERAGQDTDLVARQRLTTIESESHLLNAPAAATVLHLIVLNSLVMKEFTQK